MEARPRRTSIRDFHSAIAFDYAKPSNTSSTAMGAIGGGGWFRRSIRAYTAVMSDKKTLTTAFGHPVGDNQNSKTVGPRGPVLMEDFHLIEKMAHFNRERIPER